LFVIVQLLDPELCAFCFVEVLVDDFGLRLAEADEVDHVRKYLDKATMRRLIQVLECEVVDTTLHSSASVAHVVALPTRF
jgi:hypothetical protein